jgi:hypothetical protein
MESLQDGKRMTSVLKGKGKIRAITPRSQRHILHPRVSGKMAYNVRGQIRAYQGIYRTYGGKRFYFHSFYKLEDNAKMEARILRDKEGNYVRISKEKTRDGHEYVLWVRS